LPFIYDKIYAMNDTSNNNFFLGYAEQAVIGDNDPLLPPISVSQNGAIAKWGDSLHFIDLRVNDPGLKTGTEELEKMFDLAESRNIKVVLTLPEYYIKTYMLPKNLRTEEKRPSTSFAKRKFSRLHEKVIQRVYFYPALTSQMIGRHNYRQLSYELALPILEIAAKRGVKDIIIPVSEPGDFLDPLAERAFTEFLRQITEFTKSAEMTVHLRNGGLSWDSFKRLSKEFNCLMAYDVGTALLEGDNWFENYKKNSEYIEILLLHQALPGLDKWQNWKASAELAVKDFKACFKEYAVAKKEEEAEPEYLATCSKKLIDSYLDYLDVFNNDISNLGLFQNGGINFTPLLKEIKSKVASGQRKLIVLNCIPNVKNNEYVNRIMLGDEIYL